MFVGGLGLAPASADSSVPRSQDSSVEYRLDVLAEQVLSIDELEERASAFAVSIDPRNPGGSRYS